MIKLDGELFWKAHRAASESNQVDIDLEIDPSLTAWLQENIKCEELLNL
jgi:hypothetical protein